MRRAVEVLLQKALSLVHALELKIPPPVLALLLALAMRWLLPQQPALALPDGLRQGLTAAMVLFGMGFDIGGLVAFLRRRTTVNPLSPAKASALVTDGVYRFTRNPMYVGMAAFLSAWAVWLGAIWPWLGPVLFVLFITRFQIRPEETALARLFGDDYAHYCRRVRRWL